VESGKEMAQIHQRLEEERAALRLLDQTYPPDRFQTPATLVLSDPDVEAYLAVRAALEPVLSELDRRNEEMAAKWDFSDGRKPGAMEVMRMTMGAFSDMANISKAQMGVLQEARSALEQNGMGPAALGALAEVVEWRFLQREEARFLSLDPMKQAELSMKRGQLRMNKGILALNETEGVQINMGGKDMAQLEREVETLQADIERLEGESGGDATLAPETRALLERHRTRLEAAGTSGIEYLGMLTIPAGVAFPGAPGGGQRGFHVESGTGGV
jgi:hypothetical protein